MTGFPDVPTRQQFGPIYEDRRPVQNPDKELGADTVNLLMWQLAGASRVVAQATLLYDLASDTLEYQAFAFDPNSVLDDIQIVKNGTGIFTVTFAPTYKDQRGTDVPFIPRMAIGTVQQRPATIVGAEAATFITNQDVKVEVRDPSAVVQNRAVLIQVW